MCLFNQFPFLPRRKALCSKAPLTPRPLFIATAQRALTCYTLPMSEPRKRQLTARQQIFVENLVKYGNGARAARLAGVSPLTAHSRAEKWRAKPQIQERLRTLRQTVIRVQANHVRAHLIQVMRQALHDGLHSNAGRRATRLLTRWEKMLAKDARDNQRKVKVKSRE